MAINMQDTASQYKTYQACIVYFIVVVVLLMVCNLRAKPPPLNKICIFSYAQSQLISPRCDHFSEMLIYMRNTFVTYISQRAVRFVIYVETNSLIVRLLSHVEDRH